MARGRRPQHNSQTSQGQRRRRHRQEAMGSYQAPFYGDDIPALPPLYMPFEVELRTYRSRRGGTVLEMASVNENRFLNPAIRRDTFNVPNHQDGWWGVCDGTEELARIVRYLGTQSVGEGKMIFRIDKFREKDIALAKQNGNRVEITSNRGVLPTWDEPRDRGFIHTMVKSADSCPPAIPTLKLERVRENRAPPAAEKQDVQVKKEEPETEF